MNLPKDEDILAMGMMSLALGILVGRFTNFDYAGFAVSDFVEGLLIGLSLALNIGYMIMKRSK
jgi:hypothetical protein